jgi:hypothetical protein
VVARCRGKQYGLGGGISGEVVYGLHIRHFLAHVLDDAPAGGGALDDSVLPRPANLLHSPHSPSTKLVR